MGSEEEQEARTTLKLPLLPLRPNLEHIHSPESSSAGSSPIHSSVSVPFSWEEQPGKPKHSTHSSPSQAQPKSLELPPRLLLQRDAKEIAKLPSPTTVLDGPYSMGRSRRFDSSSFRMMLMGSENCYGSFRGDVRSPGFDELEEENQRVGALVLRGKRGRQKGKIGFVGLWRKRTLKLKGEFGGGSYVFPSSGDRESECSRKEEEDVSDPPSFNKVKITEIKSHFWASVYGGLKHVVPWKRARS